MISLTTVLLFVSGNYTLLSISRKPHFLLYPLLFNIFIGAIEEIISRGIFYRITEQVLGTHAALVLTSLLFAGFHFLNKGADALTLISIFFWSVFLGLLFTHSRSLWLPMFFYAGWNFAMAFWGTPVSGMNDFKPYELFHIETKGPEIITRGAFGPENSIITIAIILALVILFYYRAKRSGKISRPFWRKQASIISPDGRN
jgi:membrane protease YdiL (CAAX protease family)